MAQIPLYAADKVSNTVLLESNRDALIPTLKEFQRRIEHLVKYLDGLEQESQALRSAADNIDRVIEGLLSLKTTTLSRTKPLV